MLYAPIYQRKIINTIVINIASNNNDAVKEALTKHPAYVNAIIPTTYAIKDTTLLHFALQMRNTEAVTLLIQLGAKINAIDRSGNTALHFAAYGNTNEDINVVNQLLHAGADPKIKDSSGLNPYQIAQSNYETHARKGAIDESMVAADIIDAIGKYKAEPKVLGNPWEGNFPDDS